MERPGKAEEAILLASSSSAAADYLVKRGDRSTAWSCSRISEETEAALLERGDRLIDLRLAEYCLHAPTAQKLFRRNADDWPLRSLILSNRAIANSSPFGGFP